MKTDEIRKLLAAAPFRPFSVVMASEKTFLVRHPEFVLLTPSGRTLILAHSEDEAFEILDVPLIARLEVHDPAQRQS